MPPKRKQSKKSGKKKEYKKTPRKSRKKSSKKKTSIKRKTKKVSEINVKLPRQRKAPKQKQLKAQRSKNQELLDLIKSLQEQTNFLKEKQDKKDREEARPQVHDLYRSKTIEADRESNHQQPSAIRYEKPNNELVETVKLLLKEKQQKPDIIQVDSDDEIIPFSENDANRLIDNKNKNMIRMLLDGDYIRKSHEKREPPQDVTSESSDEADYQTKTEPPTDFMISPIDSSFIATVTKNDQRIDSENQFNDELINAETTEAQKEVERQRQRGMHKIKQEDELEKEVERQTREEENMPSTSSMSPPRSSTERIFYDHQKRMDEMMEKSRQYNVENPLLLPIVFKNGIRYDQPTKNVFVHDGNKFTLTELNSDTKLGPQWKYKITHMDPISREETLVKEDTLNTPNERTAIDYLHKYMGRLKKTARKR
jgi:hypothetical protein